MLPTLLPDDIEFIKGSLPELCISPGAYLRSPRLRRGTFLGQLAEWECFEQEARTYFNATSSKHINDLIPNSPREPALLDQEHIACGEATTVCGRFFYRVLYDLTPAVANAGMDIMYSLTTIDSGKVPAIKIMGKDEDIRAIGMFMEPWAHQNKLSRIFHFGGSILASVLAPVAKHMHVSSQKYAFISTYDDTMFLKIEEVDGRPTLFYSRPIRAAAKFGEGDLIDNGPYPKVAKLP